MTVDKNFYNEASSSKLGWQPDWFIQDHTRFDNRLQNAIKTFQRKHRIKPDGMCGPTTYRRLVSSMENHLIHMHTSKFNSDSVIWYNNAPFKIEWDKVTTFKDESFDFPISSGLTRWSASYPRPIKSFVNHWDVCLNSMSCAKVLKKRNISVHFCINNDGSIIQLHDLNNICWHAGSSRINRQSVGVEISNGYYLKYNS